MTDDANLSIGIDDNVTANLNRIAASVRKFAQDAGLSAKETEQAVSKITGSMGKLATSADMTKMASRNRSALIQMKTDLQKYQQQVAQGQRAQQALARGDGRDNKGAFVSQADIQKYTTALKAVENLEKRIADERKRLNSQEMRPTSPVGSEAASAKIAAEMKVQEKAALAATKANQELAKSLQQIHDRAQQGVWPPQMFRSTKQFTEGMFELSNGVRYAMYDVARNATIGGAALLALATVPVVVAAKWERAFADVQRTVQGTDATLDRIRVGLIGMSQDIPVAFADLASIASVGGQLGISANGIVQYTETIAKLTATTNLTADAAGKALGRFKAFFAEADDPSLAVTDRTFSNLASSILKVGVNSVATETGIVNVATQISSMGQYAGFTADQVVGLAGALSSVGVPPELSRGVITRLFNTIGEAVSENGTKLQDFARLAGVSSTEFAAAWGTDKFAFVFTDMIKGLEGVANGGGDAVTALHELGITSVRDVPVLLRLANAAGEAGTAGSLLAQTMNDARSGWRENIELQLQYSKISDTLSSRSKVLLQNLEALFATIGGVAVGPVKDLVNGLIGLVKGMTAVASSPAGQQLAAIALVVGTLAGVTLLLVGGLARAAAAGQGAAIALQAMGFSAAAATPLVRGLGFALGALGIVAAAFTAAAVIVQIATAANDAINPVTDLQGALAAMQADTASGDTPFATFESGADGASMSAKEAATQAERMGDLMGYSKDETYGAGEALQDAGNKARVTALNFGTASREFLKASILVSEGFKKVTSDASFTDLLVDAGFSMDKLIEVTAKGGREAGIAYLDGLKGVDLSAFNPTFGEDLSLEQLNTAASAKVLIDTVSAGVGTFEQQARATNVAGEALVKFTSATQMSEGAMEDFQVQNEEAINSMAEGFKKFVDTSSLIGFTQSFKDAASVIDDASTDVNEAADAAAGWEKSWSDAYGGAAFSLSEYMVIFERAAAEQATQTANLQTLLARGVPTDIITDLAAMGPQSAQLVKAMVTATQPELDAYVAMYGKTGFDSMVGLAAGQLAAEQIVKNAAKTLSTAQLQQLSADLQAGTPLVDAMAKWQLDAQGKPVKVPTIFDAQLPSAISSWQDYLNRQHLKISVFPNMQALNIKNAGFTSNQSQLWASGGYTGAGGKYTPKGTVHAGEFVFTKEATSAIGVGNLYGMMRSAQSGTPARSGQGYVSGGVVTDSGGTTNVLAHLSVEDRSLLMLIADRVGLTITEQTFSSLANAGNTTTSTRRTA